MIPCTAAEEVQVPRFRASQARFRSNLLLFFGGDARNSFDHTDSLPDNSGRRYHDHTFIVKDAIPNANLAPPTLGQHTEEILHNRLKLDSEQIHKLRDQGII